MGDRMRYPGRRGLRALVRLAMIIIGLVPDGVLASGFQDRAGNPDWAANAFAGMAAKGYDASTAWTNPAAMMLLPRNEIEAGVSAVIPSTEFQGQNLVGPFPTPSSNGDNPASAAPTGSLAGVWSASPAFRLGVSAETPFGQRLKYPLDLSAVTRRWYLRSPTSRSAWSARIASISTFRSAPGRYSTTFKRA